MNRLLTFAFMVMLGLAVTACGNDSASDNGAATAPPVMPTTSTTPAAAGGTAAVEHYICPAGHVGSGAAAAGSCSQCGQALVHNQAFHANQPAAAPAASGANPMFQDPSAAPATTTITPPAPEPAQNAAGVWHYTCAAGCAGGGAAAGPCATCGATLAHNAAYHN